MIKAGAGPTLEGECGGEPIRPAEAPRASPAVTRPAPTAPQKQDRAAAACPRAGVPQPGSLAMRSASAWRISSTDVSGAVSS
ncbi:hypothetical protein GCM10010302_44340 [Streptomyces polychromogenes]|uniref:Uncharacterized protein n=1 Tax=Streptomyces polychromogenes TaxID=67342 RepID=A0ABP3F8D4_9ACTN